MAAGTDATPPRLCVRILRLCGLRQRRRSEVLVCGDRRHITTARGVPAAGRMTSAAVGGRHETSICWWSKRGQWALGQSRARGPAVLWHVALAVGPEECLTDCRTEPSGPG